MKKRVKYNGTYLKFLALIMEEDYYMSVVMTFQAKIIFTYSPKM